MAVVIQSGSKQYTVDSDQTIIVDRLEKKVGDKFEMPVLMGFSGDEKAKSVEAEVVEHLKGEKIRVVKYKQKSNYHRQYGPRQHQTKILIKVK